MHGRKEWVLESLGSQHKPKESPVRPAFPDYLSVSYDYVSTIHKLFQHNVWWNCLKFSDKRDLSIRMRAFNNSKHRHVICLNFRDLFFNSLTKLAREAKASISSTIKENLLLYCCEFSVFVTAVIS